MNEIHALVNSLKQQQLTIAIAESMTCGMATDKLSGVKGISDVLREVNEDEACGNRIFLGEIQEEDIPIQKSIQRKSGKD